MVILGYIEDCSTAFDHTIYKHCVLCRYLINCPKWTYPVCALRQMTPENDWENASDDVNH